MKFLKQNGKITALIVLIFVIAFVLGMEYKAHQIRSAFQEVAQGISDGFSSAFDDDTIAQKTEEDKTNKNEKTEETRPKIKLNKSVEIDGIKITPQSIKIGSLENNNTNQFGTPPEGKFLQIAVELENITEGTIVHLQDVWDDSQITDNFGNNYSPIDSFGMSYAKGVISSQQLRPQEQASDIMVFEIPLDNAQEFTLTSNPNLYKSTGDGLLQDLSSDEFLMDFLKNDIKTD